MGSTPKPTGRSGETSIQGVAWRDSWVRFPTPHGSGCSLEINGLTWAITIAAIVALLAFDFIFHVRKAHIPTLREAAVWSAIYVGIALLFGLVFLAYGDTQHTAEYYAGYVTEKALSVDNLFVFLIIIGAFKVPREDQQKVLLFGIVFALIARTAFILVGAAAINRFAWVFYLFGLILIWTAGKTLKGAVSDDEESDDIWRRTRDDSLFSASRMIEVDPEPGELVIFGGGWRWHRVNEIEGTRPRITYGGFAGRSLEGDWLNLFN